MWVHERGEEALCVPEFLCPFLSLCLCLHVCSVHTVCRDNIQCEINLLLLWLLRLCFQTAVLYWKQHINWLVRMQNVSQRNYKMCIWAEGRMTGGSQLDNKAICFDSENRKARLLSEKETGGFRDRRGHREWQCVREREMSPCWDTISSVRMLTPGSSELHTVWVGIFQKATWGCSRSLLSQICHDMLVSSAVIGWGRRESAVKGER